SRWSGASGCCSTICATSSTSPTTSTPRPPSRCCCQRSLRAGAADRSAEERGARDADAGRHAGGQLGVHGDGVAGVDAQGVVRAGTARGGPVGRAVRGGEAGGAEDGVPDLPAGVRRDAVSDRPGGAADRLSVAGVEPVAAGVPPWRRGAATAATL